MVARSRFLLNGQGLRPLVPVREYGGGGGGEERKKRGSTPGTDLETQREGEGAWSGGWLRLGEGSLFA